MTYCGRYSLVLGVLAVLVMPATAQQPFKLKVASVNLPPSMHTLYMRIAQDEGIYKRNGLAVDDVISLTSGPLMAQALSAGHVDVGDTDAEGVLNAVAAGFGLVAVAAPSQHLSYVVMVQPEIKTVKNSRASHSRSRGRARSRNTCCSPPWSARASGATR